MIEKPDAIIVTFPVQFLLDIAPQLPSCQTISRSNGPIRLKYNTRKQSIIAGYAKCIREIEWVRKDPDERWWWHSIGTKPTQDVLYCYIVILNRIKYRANIVGWEPGGEKEFGDGRKLTAKHWLQLAHFVPAPTYIERKGFQGIRYSEKLF